LFGKESYKFQNGEKKYYMGGEALARYFTIVVFRCQKLSDQIFGLPITVLDPWFIYFGKTALPGLPTTL